jgi:hypothetical protein
LNILIETEIIYYIAEFKHPEISIIRNTAVTNIRKYQTYVIQVFTVGMKQSFSDDKIQKYEMPTKYVMKIYSKRHSITPGITNCQVLRGRESGCTVVYCANLT